MKKVLALVLTLAMLVGTLAVGLSAAFEYTATEEGDVFENVYSIPLGSKAAAVTYLAFDSSTFEDTINIEFDIWFTSEDGFIGDGTYGSPINDTGPYHLSITPDKIGLGSNGNAVSTLDYAFALNTKYTVAFRTGGAEEGKTLIRVNGEDIGQVEGRLAKDYSTICGADLVVVDNIKVSDGNNYQVEEDFEDSSWDGHVSGSSGAITESIEIRRDLGKKYLSVGSTEVGHHYQLTKVLGADGEGNVAPYSAVTVSFDFQLLNADSYVESWGSSAPSVYPNGISVGHEKTPFIEHTFEINTWYYAEFVSDGTKTDAYIDGVLVGTLDTAICFGRDGAIANAGKFWTPYNKNAAIDNVAVNGYAHTFEDGGEEYLVDLNGATITSNIVEYVGEKADIWETIQTYPVEGEAVLVRDTFNDAKDPATLNYNDFTATFASGTVGESYVVDFDLAIYPDVQGNVSETAGEEGAWLEFITNAFGNGDDSRIKIGTKFVGKNKDLWYYGQDAEGTPEYVKTMSEWQPGEFHNVAIWIANGSVTVYLDKNEVYNSPVGMNRFDGFEYFYTQNCSVIMDNYRIYDGSTFDLEVDSLVSDDATTIADVKAEGAAFCEANGHINRWARTTDPKCYEMGTNTYTCWICGNEEAKQEVAMIPHDFQGYDIHRVDESGLVYIACTESEGCPERRYIQMPAAEDYTGTINYFQDFQDDFITQLDSASWNWTIADGVSSYLDGNDLNYNQIPLEGNRKGAELNEGFKIGFDFIYNGTYETGDTPQYGNTFFLRLGQAVVGVGKIGYDAAAQQFYIGSDGNFAEIRSDVYPLVPGETYNMEIVFGPMDANLYEGNVVLYVNGVKVIDFVEDNSNPEFAGMDAYTYFAYPDDLDVNILLMYNFGVAMSIDNLVIGDNDFAWNRQYQGDVDGDYAITGSDALLMRKYLAKIDGIETLIASRADANGDGVIDAKDQLRIRKAIAAAEAEA